MNNTKNDIDVIAFIDPFRDEYASIISKETFKKFKNRIYNKDGTGVAYFPATGFGRRKVTHMALMLSYFEILNNEICFKTWIKFLNDNLYKFNF